MNTEEKLDQLFGNLRAETATVELNEIQTWLASAGIGTGVTGLFLAAKFKAFLATTLGKVCVGLAICMAGISVLGILATEPSPEERVSVIPMGAADRAKDTTVKLTQPNFNNPTVQTSPKRKQSVTDQVKEKSSLPFHFPFLPLHVRSLENEDSTGIVKIALSPQNDEQWAGVYKTYADYLAHRFYDSIPLFVGKNKIYVGSFDRVILKTAERKTSYKIGTLYGFYDGKNLRRCRVTQSQWEDYGYFTVRETNGLVLYSQVQTGYKGTQHTSFFYSLDLNAPIKKLNMKTLSSDFQNASFLEEVKKKVDRLINMSSEKWEVALKEINDSYRKYFMK